MLKISKNGTDCYPSKLVDQSGKEITQFKTDSGTVVYDKFVPYTLYSGTSVTTYSTNYAGKNFNKNFWICRKLTFYTYHTYIASDEDDDDCPHSDSSMFVCTPINFKKYINTFSSPDSNRCSIIFGTLDGKSCSLYSDLCYTSKYGKLIAYSFNNNGGSWGEFSQDYLYDYKLYVTDELKTITIKAPQANDFGMTQLKPVEGVNYISTMQMPKQVTGIVPYFAITGISSSPYIGSLDFDGYYRYENFSGGKLSQTELCAGTSDQTYYIRFLTKDINAFSSILCHKVSCYSINQGAVVSAYIPPKCNLYSINASIEGDPLPGKVWVYISRDGESDQYIGYIEPYTYNGHIAYPFTKDPQYTTTKIFNVDKPCTIYVRSFDYGDYQIKVTLDITLLDRETSADTLL